MDFDFYNDSKTDVIIYLGPPLITVNFVILLTEAVTLSK